MLTSIIVPAHNEEENLTPLLERLLALVEQHNLNSEILFVNDNSTDRTGSMIDDFANKHKAVRAVHREGNPGMGNALKDGTKEAKGEIIVWTMADLTDDLSTVPRFIEEIRNGADMVFGSRYMKGGSPGDIPKSKAIASQCFTTLSRLFIGIPVHDITNAFRAFRKEVFFTAMPSYGNFGISPEFALKAQTAGFSLTEVPTTYKDREFGETKFQFFKMARVYFGIFSGAFFQSLKRKLST